MQIIPYNSKYREQVVALILDVYENELGFLGFERPDIYKIQKIYLEEPRSGFWLAMENEEIVGTVGVLAKSAELAYLKRLVVKKEFRNQKVGKKLLRTALDFAREKAFRMIYAGTVKENPQAIEFYKSQGFVENSDVPADITAVENSICLKLEL